MKYFILFTTNLKFSRTMRKSIFFLTILSLVISCKNNTPESATQNFVKAINQYQFKEAKKYIDDSSIEYFDEFTRAAELHREDLPKSKKIDFNVSKVEQKDDNNAVVYYTIEKGGYEIHLHVIKENNQWKVALKNKGNDDHHNCNHQH